ncbi:MAG: OsmC family protein [Candidatus Zixiibacteriota bacterium]|nr:MAG: OsmC family protein [candidate division Zixibacteria bacterium]
MKTARVKWVENLKLMGVAPSGHAIAMDGPKQVGGDDSAVKPGELTLVALGGCTGIDVITILEKMRVKFDSFEVVVNAETAEEHPRVWTKIHVKYIFKGKDMDEAKVKKAITLSEEKYCSVSAMLRKTAEMTYDYEITEE